MKLTRPAPRSRPETIIALIDVVFFLLVFFMLIGRMDATAPFEVTPPTASIGADMPAGGITLSVSADGDLALEGTPLIADQIEQALAPRLDADARVLVRINAHKNAQLRRVLPLVARIEAMGAKEVVLVVTPPKPPTPAQP